MAQGEVLELLEKYGELSTQELQKLAKIGKASVNVALKKLLKQGEIKKRKIKREKKRWVIENYYKLT